MTRSAANRLDNRCILVTGAASGIGAAITARLTAEGAQVIAADLAETAAGPGVEAHRLDVCDEAGWEALVADVVARHGRLDGLVNNAGIAVTKTIEDTSLDDYRKVMAVNAEGVFLGTRTAVRAMKDSGGGVIINISSVAGQIGAPNLAAYCASKGAVRMLSKAVALSGARHGIRVNSVHPYFVETPMVDEIIDGHGDADRVRSGFEKVNPMRRLGKPADVAAMVAFLLSDDAAYANGAEFTIDGGFTAG